MIATKLHPGSGLGNSLHSYLMGRIIALDKGFDFGILGKEFFKGNSFLKLNWGEKSDLEYHIEYPAGKLTVDDSHELFEEKTNYYNPEINFVEDGTVIDGYWQSIQYFGHRMNEIDDWLEVEPLDLPNDVCVIGFRGGEFYAFPELGLPKEYFDEGIRAMKKINTKMKFEVHTDDESLARKFFPNYKIIHNIGVNWRSMRYAKYAIIANSSFYILPRLLRHHTLTEALTIAPRYWARRNIQEWSRPDNFYRKFLYI